MRLIERIYYWVLGKPVPEPQERQEPIVQWDREYVGKLSEGDFDWDELAREIEERRKRREKPISRMTDAERRERIFQLARMARERRGR